MRFVDNPEAAVLAAAKDMLRRGLVEGTGRVYDETLQVEELECMHHGASACRFLIRFP